MKMSKKILALALAALMVIAVFSGCKPQDEDPATEGGGLSIKVDAHLSETEKIADIIPDLTEAVKEKHEENEDTVGWLQIPYSTISDVVLQGKDNQYYHRRNFNKESEFAGVYYADKKADFGTGTREDLPTNITIYGHALTDDKEASNYTVRFAPLHDYRDIEYASENLYMFYSTAEANFAYEIFAIFIVNSDNPKVPYNNGGATQEEYVKLVKEEILPRSIYDYGVEIADTDKFLALSTCIYSLPDGTSLDYGTTRYRYVVMGKLVDENAPLVTKKDIVENKDVLIDPDGAMGSAK